MKRIEKGGGILQRAWVQVAIDVTDIDLAKKIAFMALDAGAEWLEVGTPLLYQYGHEAIGMLRSAVGREAKLVADYKSPFAMLCAEQAAKQGADYVMLSVGYNDWVLEKNFVDCRAAGIEPIFDLAVRQDDLYPTIRKLVSLGGTYMFSRHYSTERKADGTLVKTDNMPLLLQETKDYILGITSDDYDEMCDAVSLGADWIVFGYILRNPNAASCKRWVDAVHKQTRSVNL